MLPHINAPFAWAAGLTGASVDELKLIFQFLLSYPLAGVLKRVPDSRPWAKNVFIVGVSIFYLIGLFDLWSGLGVLLVSAGGTYAISSFVQGPYMPWVNFVFLMGYMSVSHIYRQIVSDPGLVDITGAQMVLVMKLTAFGWNVFDGTQKVEYLDDYQKVRALKSLPSILDYLGYVFFFPSLMAGPAFDFADYRSWIETSMFDLPPGTDPSKAPATRKKRRIPRSGTPAAINAAIGLAWILAFLQFSKLYSSSVVLDESYKGYSFVRRVWLLHMLGMTTRMKYYGVWALTEGSCILSGIGFKGIDPVTGKADWSRLQNVRPFGVEFAQNSHAYLGNWNMNTNNWLRNYVYLRVTPRGKKPGFRATMATFVTSAFWHGFYPGYYMSFILASFIQNIAKNSRRLLRPFFMTPDGKAPLPTKRYYDFFSYVVTQLAFSFTTAPFVLLDIGDSLVVWMRLYFYAVVGVVASSLFLLTPGKAWLSKQVKKHQAQPVATADRPGMFREDSNRLPTYLGLPNDPGKEWDEMIDEIAAEIERRRSDGKPIGEEVKKVLREKFGDGTVRLAEQKKVL
ncbi:putative membrane protein [Myriangium duriaei CBS 260.36]|uniref:Membrane protein n=1 Tax=Myriangium duriaei CBS 260.36 TaxID=1168546 RepID=A0A9P4JFL7_9PEZI|nr:putative membrane protein [Myriangium duriaei CBS 260.36]